MAKKVTYISLAPGIKDRIKEDYENTTDFYRKMKPCSYGTLKKIFDENKMTPYMFHKIVDKVGPRAAYYFLNMSNVGWHSKVFTTTADEDQQLVGLTLTPLNKTPVEMTTDDIEEIAKELTAAVEALRSETVKLNQKIRVLKRRIRR